MTQSLLTFSPLSPPGPLGPWTLSRNRYIECIECIQHIERSEWTSHSLKVLAWHHVNIHTEMLKSVLFMQPEQWCHNTHGISWLSVIPWYPRIPLEMRREREDTMKLSNSGSYVWSQDCLIVNTFTVSPAKVWSSIRFEWITDVSFYLVSLCSRRSTRTALENKQNKHTLQFKKECWTWNSSLSICIS